MFVFFFSTFVLPKYSHILTYGSEDRKQCTRGEFFILEFMSLQLCGEKEIIQKCIEQDKQFTSVDKTIALFVTDEK